MWNKRRNLSMCYQAETGQWGWRVCLWGLLFSFMGMTPLYAQNADQLSLKKVFLDTEITPFEAFYIVRADVNVRAKPTQKSEKVGRLDEGARIYAVGRANKDWVAYREQEKDVGFVYEPVLMPVIDSTLWEEVKGTLAAVSKPKCDYTINFVGKSTAEGQIFQIGDYEVDWKCLFNGKTSRFSTPMFLTEGPYVPSQKSVHQVTIDILDLAINLEEVLSTNLFYDHEKMRVRFDGISSKRMSVNKPDAEVAVTSLPSALQAAVQLAHEAWGEPLWAELLKRQQ